MSHAMLLKKLDLQRYHQKLPYEGMKNVGWVRVPLGKNLGVVPGKGRSDDDFARVPDVSKHTQPKFLKVDDAMNEVITVPMAGS